MPTVQFTSNLKRFFPDLAPTQLEGDTVAALMPALEEKWPGLTAYLVDEQGRLRKHVTIYIGNEPIRDKDGLTDALRSTDEVYILQALSGG